MDAAAGTETDDVGEADPCTLSLTLARPAPKMRGDLVDVCNTGCADRMTLREQATREIHRDSASEPGRLLVDHLARFSVSAETEVLVVEDLCGGKAVMQLDEVQVVGADTRHLVCLGRRVTSARTDVGHDFVAIRPGIGREDRRTNLDGLAEQAELLHLLLRHENGRGRAVDVGRAHQLRVRIGDHLRVHHFLEGRFDLVARLGIHGRVVVILDRDLGELLEGRAVFLGVRHAGFREDARHRAGAQQSFGRNAFAGAAAAKHAGPRHFLDADGEDGVVESGPDCGPAFPERRGTGRAGIRAVDDGNPRLTDLFLDLLSDHGRRHHQVATVEGLNIVDRDSGVVECEQCRLGAERGDRAVGESAELDHVDSGDVDVFTTHVVAPGLGREATVFRFCESERRAGLSCGRESMLRA